MFKKRVLIAPKINNVDVNVALGSISPTFSEQLLRAQIPKAQKDSQVITVFLHIWDLHG